MRHPIKPHIVPGVSYIATAFEASMKLSTSGQMSHLKVHFISADGSIIPDGVMAPIEQSDPEAAAAGAAAALNAIITTPANEGENLPQLFGRGIALYVEAVYGISILT